MNQEEEIPTRVTRGALRRRSVDQEATPQKPSGTVATGTPKKTNSTTKKVNALNPIQESEGRPSTPIVGRTTRRRMSETIDTPTLPNKLVQNLKGTGTESGKRSRNTSLTEENLGELNVAYEGNTGMLSTRSRTPARVRASHETLITTVSPVTVTPAVRRSTRRNSVTSDDGNISVQSLPITTPKMNSGLRALKDDTIIEEDAGDDRAESVSSESSTRHMRSQSALPHFSASASPRSTTASPLLAAKHETTPPRAGTTSRVALTPLSLSKVSPRSKNVSFNDDTKREDNQNSKTPTSLSKKVFIVVEDLRNSEFKGVSPKVDAIVDLSPKIVETEKQAQSINSTPICENIERDDQTMNEIVHSVNEDKTDASSLVVAVQNDECIVGKVNDNNVSGIDVLESSVKEEAETVAEDIVTVNDSIRSTDQPLSEGNKFSQSWSQSVRRSATKGIDEYSVRKQEEEKRLEEAKECLQIVQMDTSYKASSPAANQHHSSDKSEVEEEDDEEMEQRNEFVDDEALEVEDYQSCDSMDDDLKREMEGNEIPDHGEDLGSEDTEENDDQEDDEDENDSWVVSDGDEERLLRSSNEDLTMDSSNSHTESKTINRRRIIDSEEKEEKENSIDFEKKSSPMKSPKSNTSNRRSATPVSVPQTSVVETTVSNLVESLATPATDATPTKTSIAPVKISSNKKQLSEPAEVESPEKEDAATDCSSVMFEDANEVKENSHQNDKEMENGASLSTSPEKIAISRKSLPIDAANLKNQKSVADARKSLPANVKLQFDEETDVHEVEPGIDNNKNKEEAIDLEEDAEVEIVYEDNKAINKSSSSQFTSEQPVNEMSKLDRKSMPPISLISAQFYIGGTKKRNTVGDENTNMLTSTPKPNETSVTNKKSVVAEKTNSNVNNSFVRNPFALANSAKLKSRASLDSGTAIKQNVKKSRLSLPSKFVEEDVPSESVVGSQNKNGSQEPEPMEVDEVIEEENVVNEGANNENDNVAADDDVSVQEIKVDEKLRTTKIKPKPKALEDYDLTNILVRCNDFMREEKERKKHLASVLRKKKVEKKRLRELEKQEELEVAKNAAKTISNNDADPNNVNASTGNDSTGQTDEPAKKKKKRKPKTKNYLLEELAETKKERLEQALRHKLEVMERRKQRKKERQLEKKKQLNKENGNSVNVTGGIGAKLEKMKKKQTAKTGVEAKTAGGNESKDPKIRVAVSAFAVFNELSNNQVQLSSPNAAVDAKKMVPSNKAQLVVSPEKQRHLQKNSNKKESSDQQKNPKETVKTQMLLHSDVKASKEEPETAEPLEKAIENEKEKLLSASIERQTSSADNVTVCKKKPNMTVPLENLMVPNNKLIPPLLQSASDGLMEDAGRMSKKRKMKQAMAPSSEGSENAFSDAHKLSADGAVKPVEGKVTAKIKPYSIEEKPKEKKQKKEHVSEKTFNAADSEIPKQKKNKKIKLNGAAEDYAKLSSANSELRPELAQSVKTNKSKKKLASLTENDAMEVENMNELTRKKPTSVKMEPTMPVESIAPAKKRKREQQGDSSVVSTPRPAKHTKLRVLQRIESGGFFVENVTPDKVRLKRNFGFQERPATPAKQLGFKVSSILPTAQEELRDMATSSKKYSKDGRKKSKFGNVIVPERNLSLPLPVWTSSGVFFESAADCKGGDNDQKKTQKDKPGDIQLKSQGMGEFNVKALRPGPNAEKPHRVDPTTIEQSVLNFKRQHLLEKTAHLRVKKKNQRV